MEKIPEGSLEAYAEAANLYLEDVGASTPILLTPEDWRLAFEAGRPPHEAAGEWMATNDSG